MEAVNSIYPICEKLLKKQYSLNNFLKTKHKNNSSKNKDNDNSTINIKSKYPGKDKMIKTLWLHLYLSGCWYFATNKFDTGVKNRYLCEKRRN